MSEQEKDDLQHIVERAVVETGFNQEMGHNRLYRLLRIGVYIGIAILVAVVINISIVMLDKVNLEDRLNSAESLANQKRLEMSVKEAQIEAMNNLLVNHEPSSQTEARLVHKIGDKYIATELADSPAKTIDEVKSQVCIQLENEGVPCY
jgi:hypothetical protein